VASAIAQRVELTSASFDDSEAITVRYKQIMLLLGDNFIIAVPFDEEYERSRFWCSLP